MADVKSKLMRKTKEELCQIILRKDGAETNLKTENTSLQNEINKQQIDIVDLRKKNKELDIQVQDYQAELDNCANERQILKNALKGTRFLAAIAAVIVICCLISMVY